MFNSKLGPDGSILMDEKVDSRLGTSIHMFFMNFNIGVIWVNSDYCVVDKVIAKRWYPFYMSKSPARYILETHPERLGDFSIGDKIRLRTQPTLS